MKSLIYNLNKQFTFKINDLEGGGEGEIVSNIKIFELKTNKIFVVGKIIVK